MRTRICNVKNLAVRVTGTLKHVKSSVARASARGIVLRWSQSRSSGYAAGGYSGFHFFLRKTLFDFIKSCGGRIDLKFSGVALLGLLYSPLKKEKKMQTLKKERKSESGV